MVDVKQDVPLYATIAMLGGHYAVTFHKAKSLGGSGVVTSTHSGSSETLFDKYRGSGIPLVDYRTVRDGEFPRGFNGVREACVFDAWSDPSKYPALSEYVEMMRGAGATIGVL